jgi:hypothetical protein
MIDDLLNNINNETELLEAVCWDDDELARLIQYLNSIFENEDIKNFKNILLNLEKEFNADVKILLEKLFEETIFINNMHTSSSEFN